MHTRPSSGRCLTYLDTEGKETKVEVWNDVQEAMNIIDWAIDYYKKHELNKTVYGRTYEGTNYS